MGSTAAARKPTAPPDLPRTSFLVIIWLLASLAIVLVFTRLYVRKRFVGRLQIDDGLVALAACILLTQVSLYTWGASRLWKALKVGAGQLPPPTTKEGMVQFADDVNLVLRQSFASIICFWTCIWTVKASFLTFFFPLSHNLRWERLFWYAVTTVVVLTYIILIIHLPLVCGSHVEHNFKMGECTTPGNVHQQQVSLRMSTAFDIGTDLLIMAIPWKLILVVKKSLKEKMAIGGVVGLSFIIILFSAIRIAVINSAHQTSPSIIWIELWSGIEASIAVIIISLTAFRIFIVRRAGYGSQPYSKGHSSGVNSQIVVKKSATVTFQDGIALDDVSEEASKRNGSEEILVHAR